MACSAWLQSIDGELVTYAAALERQCPTFDDIVARYVHQRNQQWLIDEKFFLDIGIDSVKHRHLFAEWFAQGPPHPKDELEASDEARCLRWLQEVDPSGACMSYAEGIAAQYSSLGEILDAHVKKTYPRGGNGPLYELQPEFFTCVGVSNQAHQQLFQTWFARGPFRGQRFPPGLKALFNLSLEEWLHACDCHSGRLERYRQALLRNFDSIEQIVELYVSGGKLDTEFFSDLGVEQEEDRAMFQASIQKSGSQLQSEIPSERLPAEAFRGWGFAAWLREVDKGTRILQCYTDRFEEQYDTVEQIVAIYSRADGGGRCTLTSLFFEDAGVTVAQHKQLFQDWFSTHCLPPRSEELHASRSHDRVEMTGGDTPRPSEEGPSHRPRPERGRFAALGTDFGAWLQLVGIPPDGPAFQRYLKACQANPRILSVDQLIDQYLISDPQGGYVLDCQLFRELDIQNAEHRQLVEDWLLGSWREEADHVPRGSESLEVTALERGPEAPSFAQWLQEVGCPEYGTTLEEMYDTPEQVVRLYTSSLSSTHWDRQFFKDARIHPQHEAIFNSWLVASRRSANKVVAGGASGSFEAVD